MTKNLLLVAALLAASCAPAFAQTAAVGPILQAQNGARVGPFLAPDLTWIGAPVFRIETSTPADQAVLLLAGQGLLYSIRCTSGSTGAYGMAFDSATTSGITVGTLGKAIGGPAFSSGQIQVSASAQTVNLASAGYFDFTTHPVPFTNGLVGIVHGSVLNCLFQARLTSGNNPGP